MVTGYVRLDLRNRPHADFLRLGNEMLSLGVPMTAFIESAAAEGFTAAPGVEVRDTTLAGCWLARAVPDAAIPPGNPDKDTFAFHVVQHEKSAWIAQAAATSTEPLLCWLDLGLLHVRGVTPDGIAGLVERLALRGARDRVTMASIWGPPALSDIDPVRVGWWCAGGVLVVPRSLAEWFDQEARASAAVLQHAAGHVTWEVNVWAHVWARHPDRFAHWRCDHDATLVEAGP